MVRTKKDIVIPAGTIFQESPAKTERFGGGHYEAVIGLTDDSAQFFNVCLDDDGLDKWFEEA